MRIQIAVLKASFLIKSPCFSNKRFLKGEFFLRFRVFYTPNYEIP